MAFTIYEGDSLAVLRTMPSESVHCCVTSPPYWGLRDYGVAGQLGLERTPDEFVANMVAVFSEIKRVLHPTGSLWLNVGDSYNAGRNGGHPGGKGQWKPEQRKYNRRSGANVPGLKPKDLVGVPWLLAIALRADGWYLRDEIIWHKPNTMPLSVKDRTTRAHEQLFLLSKKRRYFYDQVAINEPAAYPNDSRRPLGSMGAWQIDGRERGANGGGKPCGRATASRNKRSVWRIPTESFKGSHFATMPQRLVEPCVLAGSSDRGVCPACLWPWHRVVERVRRATRPGERTKVAVPAGWNTGDGRHDTITGRYDSSVTGNRDPERHVTETRTVGWEPTCDCNAAEPIPATILDPFAGAGTTLLVAEALGRDSIGIELNPAYAAMARERIRERRGLKIRPQPPFALVQAELFDAGHFSASR